MNQQKKTESPVARRLRSARTKVGISQKQLGIQAGMDQFSASPRINQYERGKHVPDFATAARLAQVLLIPVTYLYADNDELAELILLFTSATKEVQEETLNTLRNQ